MINMSTYVLFGAGTIAVTCGQRNDQHYVIIRDNKIPAKIGDKLPTDMESDLEIYLLFPDEIQMLTVLAAFTKKTYDQTETMWKEEKAKKDGEIGWKVQIDIY
jgi:hypothetical protein